MSNMRKLASTALVGTAVGTLLMVGNGHAVADPPNPPPYRAYAAVGSDTIQAVWNGLTNAGATAPTITGIASYDATGSTTIKTKAAGATFCRPVGSGNGAKALSAVWDPNYNNNYSADCTAGGATVPLQNDEVDFSRSSSGPTAGADTGLTYLPFARDAVSVAINPYTSGSSILNFTTAQLAAIYGGSDDNTAGTGVTYDAATGLPKFHNHILTPLLPQSGSGTRKFFQAAINIPDSDMGPYVNIASATVENDGTALTDAGDLIPFSAAQWIGQNNGVQNDTTAGDKLLKINGKTAFVNAAPHEKPGTLFGTKTGSTYNTPPQPGVGVFARDTYNVVPTSFFGGTTAQQTLITKLTGTANGNVGGTAAQKVIATYGFGNLSYIGDQNDYLLGAFQH